MEMKRPAGKTFLVIIGLGIMSLIVVSMASGLLEKWLWMRQVGYQQVFWKILTIQSTLFRPSLRVRFRLCLGQSALRHQKRPTPP